ncbi:MAG: class I SAM-dependent methyltransferase [bacterium]|nr:class I SAM-dependent methyltransferase [bacterium]
MRKRRPSGQPTRGKTALNRLRQIDTYILLAWPHVLTSGTPLIVDVGYGAYPWTALEMWERWLPLNSRLRLLGVEIAPERVAAAQPSIQDGLIDFRLGGFDLQNFITSKSARIIRAYNVLRQYAEEDVPSALHEMAQALEPGGLLIEGTSTPSGHLVVFDVYQTTFAGTLEHRALVFGTNFRQPAEPIDFQTILPKRLIHHALDERPALFFDHWRRSLVLARANGQDGRRHSWIYAARLLKERYGYPIDTRKRLLRRGYLSIHDRLYP